MKTYITLFLMLVTLALAGCATAPYPQGLTMSQPGSNGAATDLDD
jgi:starvation-inducible outer membrane lipoprotein